MKLEDLYLINKEEWLDVIKDKCKKKAKTDFWLGLAYLLFMILFLIVVIIGINLFGHDKEGFVYILTIFLLALVSGWWVLKSHSFFKTIDGLATPEHLLNKFKKYVKDKSIIWTIGELIFCGWFACFVYTADLSIILKVIGWIVILVSAIVHIYRLIRGKYVVGYSEDITRRLHELIGEE